MFKSLFEAKSSQVKVQEKLERKYGLQSGSATRSDGDVFAGWASMQGKRASQEDTVVCSFEQRDGQEVGCFGVFDGHGGPAAALYVKEQLPRNILGHANFADDVFKAIEEGFLKTDQEYLADAAHADNDDGTTALFTLVVGHRLLTAHVGDSRAVMHDGRQVVALSRDHKPNRADEKIRIEGSGGSVVWAGTWRVGGVLAVSRSFGNRLMKDFIIPHPEIREDILSEATPTWLVLGTDGLWDVVTNEEAVKMARKCTSPEAAARKLAAEAYLRGSQDNISVVVCEVAKHASA